VGGGRHYGKLVGVVDFEIVGIEVGFDLGLGRSFVLWVGFAAVAGCGQGQETAES
jgi:hypothetical protein